MIKLVVGVNVVIALLGFYLTWRIWQAKQMLRSATVALTTWERSIHQALDPERTPALILQGQQTTASARRGYAHLQTQLRQLQKTLALALVVLRLLQQNGRFWRVMNWKR